MMDYNQQQLQTFLIQAQLINQKVKALAQNKISTQEIDKFALQRAQDRRKRQEVKLRKEQELLQKKRIGRDGKGIAKDFSHFCRFCHKQYEIETPTCLKCNRPTMTLIQRQAQLQNMVEDYKFNKKTREQKRQKWQMFQKTQAALWKKSNINYNKKWEYFVQDSEQQVQKQPILPKNDPNFMALEADIQQRKKKRTKDKQNAKRLKQKGNNAMKEGDYQKAMQFYTLALEHIKDIKSVYTNRALAFIKLKKYKKAIKDCTNVIEYMQIFEKVGQSKDLTFKAYSRRALAKKQIKEYKEALQDIKQALKLFPQDKNGLILKKQIESFIQHSQTVQKLIRQNRQKQLKQVNQQQKQQQSDSECQEQKSKRIEKQIIKQLAENELKQEKSKDEQKNKHQKQQSVQKRTEKELNPLTAIPEKIKNLSEANVQYLLNLLINKKQYRSLFISSKGIEAMLDHLTNNQSPKNEALLITVCLDGDGVGQKRVWDWGVFKIMQLIKQKFLDETKLNQTLYGFIDNLILVLVPITLSDSYRPLLSSNPKTFQFIEFMFSKLITKHKKQSRLVDNFLTFFSNLCSGDSALKNSFLKKDKVSAIVGSLFYMILDVKTKNRQILDLRQTIYSFIANLITVEQHRKFFVDFLSKNNKLVDLKQELYSYPRTAHNFQPYIENVLSVLANASIDGLIQSQDLAEAIFNRFVRNWQQFNSTIVFRALMILGRLKYTSNKQSKSFIKVFDKIAEKIDPLVKQEDKYNAQVVKILNILFMAKQTEMIAEIPKNLMNSLTRYIKENSVNQQLFCNSCNLFGIILDQKNVLTDKILVILRPIIGKLVQIAKEKTGNWRKSAAILLGKSSFDAQCRQELNRHHGMQVLKSIASFVTPNK